MSLRSLGRSRSWVALGSVVVLGAFLAPFLYVGDLKDSLVQEANEVVAAPRVRPSSSGDPNPAESYARYSRVDTSAERRLDLLVAATASRRFRREQGRWPASLEALTSSGLLRPEEADRLMGLVFAEEQGGGALRIAVPLPRVSAGQAPDAITRMWVEER